MIKKISFLTLALFLGFGHFAYASAKMECASMMSSKAGKMACCPQKSSCQCEVKAPSGETPVPAQISSDRSELADLPHVFAVYRFDLIDFSKQTAFFRSPPQSSPPLISVLRI